ncbi:MAG: hypothetical protein H7A53_11775 [Akkermansiaceae bacterium]|nr:hypothetical protein [Akkermansiaceae bacterium]MCP5551558.1 hypothetical protein [Akkermansiaceae bacterium]
MPEILQEALKGHNLPLTILVGVVLLYWVVSMFGLVDLDSMDGGGADAADGLDGGADDGGADDGGGEDGDSENGHHHGLSFLQAMVRFVGASDAPLTFVLTLLVMYTWGANVLANHYLNAGGSTSRANLILIPVVIGAFILTRLTVRPLRPLMKFLRKAEESVSIVGLTGTVRSLRITEEYGQIEVDAKGAPLLLNARLSDGAAALEKGAGILVVAKDEERDLWVVRALPDRKIS